MTSFGFDVAGTKPSTTPAPLPTGWYSMRISAADVASSERAGDMVKVTFEVLENVHVEFAGRKAFANFCHQHPTNAQTREIARGQISAICHAIGKPNATAVEEMLGGELKVRLVAVPAKDGYDAKSEPKGFKSLNEATDAPPAAGTTKPSVGAAAAPKQQPWKAR